MELVVITSEKMLENEAVAINRLFVEGLQLLHLRKPESGIEELRALLRDIDPAYHQRIVLHDHFVLTEEFGLKGVHLNRRNSQPPVRQGLSVSKSCHNWDELHDSKAYNYVFLSPIFDSISKSGYAHAFSEEELVRARRAGWIHRKVYALGGVSRKEIKQAAHYGFGGVVVLGALWAGFGQECDIETLVVRYRDLQKECQTNTLR